MGYWPQIQHKTGQPPGCAESFGKDGGGLGIVECLAILQLAAKGDRAYSKVRDGTFCS
jgi:hypothetical protein